MPTPRTLEPWRPVLDLQDFEALIGRPEVSYFYFKYANYGRPKHQGFVVSLQYWYLRNKIRSRQLYVARRKP